MALDHARLDPALAGRVHVVDYGAVDGWFSVSNLAAVNRPHPVDPGTSEHKKIKSLFTCTYIYLQYMFNTDTF